MINERSKYSEQLLHQFQGFLNTPPLWTSSSFFKLEQMELPQVDPDDLDEFNLKVPKRLILGKRAELFFQYCMERYSEEFVLANNIQVHWEKQTIGELDFLLLNKESNAVSHVEVVYKFYLYDPSFEVEMERWIGPNRRDTLLKKLFKLENQQFPLLYRKETKPYLDKLGLSSTEIRQSVCFKANLFIPFHHPGEFFPHVNNNAIVGFWLKKSEFTRERFGNYEYYTPKKRNWPIEPRNNIKWYHFEEINEQLAPLIEQKRSPLVWIKKNNNEYNRFFIVWW